MGNSRIKLFSLCKLLIITSLFILPLGINAQTNVGQPCQNNYECFGQGVFCDPSTNLCAIDIQVYAKIQKLAEEQKIKDNNSDNIKYTPQIGIPNSDFDKTIEFTERDISYIGKYIKAIYDYGLGIAGILAAIVVMIGGYLWVTSGGSPTIIARSKGIIAGGVIGLIILFCSWIILNTINPSLVNFKIPGISDINKIILNSCCEYNNPGGKDNAKENISQEDCEAGGGTFYNDAVMITQSSGIYDYCAASGCCLCTVRSGSAALAIETTNCTDKKISGHNISLETCKSICKGQDSNAGIEFKWGPFQCKGGNAMANTCENEELPSGGSW